MPRFDAANAITAAFEDGYEELFLAVRPHLSARETQTLCRAAFNYLIKRYLKTDEKAIPSADCLLHTARAFVQVHLERRLNTNKDTKHHNPTLSS
ncbi:MAG: hypothetical protein QF781_00490 [Phycisphaerales bacterium]|jgi:hypothetical protein|nr:hypothetical protein [Phycisphaerales bacterium]MDP6310618.1 hypothetical protein [Phycisphaerales bacterium]MDP7189985.1 hypothetical protein [Phycisphaerales bacterium]MDP7519862.1 hypothetical protein [Phycisphaerales bacterium]HCA38170.1 hypothetical protein [Phycisphaerales bacterium]|tara:strand:+ start:787 stop:1071 length:285 start_codon:yes stop_codon:yes gene_type:complete